MVAVCNGHRQLKALLLVISLVETVFMVGLTSTLPPDGFVRLWSYQLPRKCMTARSVKYIMNNERKSTARHAHHSFNRSFSLVVVSRSVFVGRPSIQRWSLFLRML